MEKEEKSDQCDSPPNLRVIPSRALSTKPAVAYYHLQRRAGFGRLISGIQRDVGLIRAEYHDHQRYAVR